VRAEGDADPSRCSRGLPFEGNRGGQGRGVGRPAAGTGRRVEEPERRRRSVTGRWTRSMGRGQLTGGAEAGGERRWSTDRLRGGRKRVGPTGRFFQSGGGIPKAVCRWDPPVSETGKKEKPRN